MADNWRAPVLVKSYVDEDCGCPNEEWVYRGVSLYLHLDTGSAVDAHADSGDWGHDIPMTTLTMEAGRAEAFAWVEQLPFEDR